MVSAAVSSALAAAISAVPPQLLAELLIARSPVALKSTAAMVTLEVPVSFSVTVRSALLVLSSRLMPLKPESPASVVDLARIASNWAGEVGAHRGVGGLLRLGDQRLGRLHQLGDRGDAVVGGLDGVECAAHRIEQVAEVAGAVLQALRREEVDRIVERRVDPLAGGELGLGRGDQVRRLLQLQKVGPDARRSERYRFPSLIPVRIAAAPLTSKRHGEKMILLRLIFG